MNIKNIIGKLKHYRDNREDINVSELIDIVKTNPNTILLDVRSPQEFKEGHLNRSN